MDERTIATVFGEQLKMLRQKEGISQERLAHLSGYHPTYISHLETGKKQPTLQTTILIAKSLGVKLSALLEPFDK